MSSTLETIFNLTLQTLRAIPDPISSAVIGIVCEIWNAVQQTSQNKHQLRLLFQRVCETLCSLKVPQNYGDESIQKAVDFLVRALGNILQFVVSEQRRPFLRSMLSANDLKLKIEEHERHIWTACLGFQNAALLSANRKLDDLWAQINSHQNQQNAIAAQQLAIAQDTSDKLRMLRSAIASTTFLDELLTTLQADPTHMLTAMQAVLEREETGKMELRSEERDFLKAGVRRLESQMKGKKVEVKSWTVTSFEMERGFLLGSDITSTIRVGRWLGSTVGILELKSSETVLKVVESLDSLRSMRIQGLLGASTTDSPPFLLLPYMPDNVLDYLQKTQAPDYLRLVTEIARGLDYLHSRDPPVAHGAIRPATVYVDSQGGPKLTCTGISVSELVVPDADTELSLHSALAFWRAPELMDISSPATPAGDIYSYGLLLSSMLGVLKDMHSDPPFDGDALLQKLIDPCINPDPAARPSAGKLLEMISGVNPALHEGDLFSSQASLDFDEIPRSVAERWRVVPTARRAYGVVRDGYDPVYLATQPIDGLSENPLRRLSFEIRCHDQGAERTTALPQDGAYAWIEAALRRTVQSGSERNSVEVNLEEEAPGGWRGHLIGPTRFEVVRCPFADSTPRTHRMTFDHQHPFVQLAKKGDRITLHPKAIVCRFPGWMCFIYSAEVHVVSEW
ncbi:kinase-like protein [Neolentinus lepideus HHB14362 ss-1]|uniref:Kinase-like protein n=1 Tax=Neolentinus lepideus HHB14362 ss-1 TaxID=1314782 RepID=A0A165PSQ2_9AGAM|nr:kinase-like protein [Neolentinus lepideus HHB14362 ss-1]